MFRTIVLKAAAAVPVPSSMSARTGERIVVLGSGWGGFQIAQNITKEVSSLDFEMRMLLLSTLF